MNKACPVVIRTTEQGVEILAFEHPLGGNQIVKGTLEAGESLAQACSRELEEESGLVGQVSRTLGTWQTDYQNQVWGVCLMAVKGPLKNHWSYLTQDGGGLQFRFFWQPLDQSLVGSWHPLFRGALEFIKHKL